MRFFFYDKQKRAAVHNVRYYEMSKHYERFMKIIDLGGTGDGTYSPNNPYNFYVEEWRDEMNRCLKFASIHKSDSEPAKWAREEAAAKNHFNMVNLVSLEVPTDEFEKMIHDFEVEPIII